MNLIVAESSAKCLSLARIAKLVTGDVWRYAVAPFYTVEHAGKRKPALTDDHRPRLRWQSWRKVLDGARDAGAVYIATDPDRAGEFLARAIRAEILEHGPDRVVHRMRCAALTATEFEREYRAERAVDDHEADAFEAELSVNRVVSDALTTIIGGGGRALAPALAELAKLHGVQRGYVDASGIPMRSTGAWDGREVPGELTPSLTYATVEVPRPGAPLVETVVAESHQKAIVAWNAVQQLYALGLVRFGPVDGEAIVDYLTSLDIEAGDPPVGGDVQPVDLEVTPSDVPPHVYDTYLTLWCATLASAARPAVVERTIVSVDNLMATSEVVQHAGFTALRIDQPQPKAYIIPERLTVYAVTSKPWGMTEGEFFARLRSMGLRYRNPALLLKLMENHDYVEYDGQQIVPTDAAVQHLQALNNAVPELTSPSFYRQAADRFDQIASGEQPRVDVVAHYRRWIESVKTPIDEWKSGSVNA